MSKYHNRKVKYDGWTFDSQKECDRYIYLKQLQRRGVISSLTLQKKFPLVKPYRIGKKTILHGVNYYCDFFYYDKDGNAVVEDVKGIKTDVYIIKKKLMAEKYGILIKEI